MDRIEELPELRLHVFGHIHHSYGKAIEESGRVFVNACICDEGYQQAHPPIVVDL